YLWTSLLLLASLGMGDVMCGCHGLQISPWATSAEAMAESCHDHDHDGEEGHASDCPSNCDCVGSCCRIFLTPQQKLDRNSSLFSQDFSDFFLASSVLSYSIQVSDNRMVEECPDSSIRWNEPSLFILNASLLI
ncbi:MAG: hypothetical protein KC978_08445, partial [Candidatus Omnitrophica bacterium]|nr:hypothetical protein [Candidatus Omnitrophota bacterium]